MLRKQSDETDPADWFYLGADRLKVADLAWKHEGLTASGLELLQEAVERYLKGLLIAKGWKLIKTHDLVTLVAEAGRFDPRFDKYRPFAQELTDDFFAQHYPGEDWQEVGKN
jgi:HEPN domain-containing protein